MAAYTSIPEAVTGAWAGTAAANRSAIAATLRSDGWGASYDGASASLMRTRWNQLLCELTSLVHEAQTQGVLEYASTVDYPRGAVVRVGATWHRALKANGPSSTATSPTATGQTTWRRIFRIPEWSSTVSYSAGEWTRKGTNFWTAAVANTNKDPEAAGQTSWTAFTATPSGTLPARDTEALKVETWAEGSPVNRSAISAALRASGWGTTFSATGGDVPARERLNQIVAEITGWGANYNVLGTTVMPWLIDRDYPQYAMVQRKGLLYYANGSTGPDSSNTHAATYPETVGQTVWTRLIGEQTVPAAPATPVGTPSSRSIQVRWTAPFNGGADISGYDVQWKTGSESYSSVREATVTGTDYTITGLATLTAYQFRVRATNANGDGPWSSDGAATTVSTTPGKPGLSESCGDGSATLTIAAPSDNGGSAITSYTIQWKSGSQSYTETRSQTTTTTSATVTGLTNETEYTFRVRATNSNGSGPWSDESTCTPLPSNYSWNSPGTYTFTWPYDATKVQVVAVGGDGGGGGGGDGGGGSYVSSSNTSAPSGSSGGTGGPGTDGSTGGNGTVFAIPARVDNGFGEKVYYPGSDWVGGNGGSGGSGGTNGGSGGATGSITQGDRLAITNDDDGDYWAYQGGGGGGGEAGASGGNSSATFGSSSVTGNGGTGGGGGGGGGGEAGSVSLASNGRNGSDGTDGTGGGAGGTGTVRTGTYSGGDGGDGGNGNGGSTTTGNLTGLSKGSTITVVVGAGGAGGDGGGSSATTNGSAGDGGSVTLTPLY